MTSPGVSSGRALGLVAQAVRNRARDVLLLLRLLALAPLARYDVGERRWRGLGLTFALV